MKYSDHINKVYPTLKFPVSEKQVESFIDSIGIGQPAPEALSGGEAPLTFGAVLLDSEFSILADMGIQLNQCIHMSQEYNYHHPLKAGDTLMATSRLFQVDEKPGKGSRPTRYILQFKTHVENDKGRDLFDASSVILVIEVA